MHFGFLRGKLAKAVDIQAAADRDCQPVAEIFLQTNKR